MYLVIENNGEIQPEAITLLGASTKRGNDETIGMFGSGNKYALAYFMRKGMPVQIYSGTKQIPITTEITHLGEHEFQVLVIDGKRTSITTETGPQWTLWQAIREVWSNALDEGGAVMDVHTVIEPKPGKTLYCIPYEQELHEFYDNFDDYFATRREAFYQDSGVRFYKKKNEGGKVVLYRKGIRASEAREYSLYDYDFARATVNEERLFHSHGEINSALITAYYRCPNAEVIKKFISVHDDHRYWEHNARFSLFAERPRMSPAWGQALEGCYVAPNGFAPLAFLYNGKVDKPVQYLEQHLYDDFRRCFGSERIHPGLREREANGGEMKYKPTEMEQAMVNQVLHWFDEAAFPVTVTVRYAALSNSSYKIDGDVVVFGPKGLTSKSSIAKVLLDAQLQHETRQTDKTPHEVMIDYMAKMHQLPL